MIDDMTVAPGIELVACKKISINGKPVGLSMAASKSPMQNSTAIIIPKPMQPLSTTVIMIDLGTIIDGR